MQGSAGGDSGAEKQLSAERHSSQEAKTSTATKDPEKASSMAHRGYKNSSPEMLREPGLRGNEGRSTKHKEVVAVELVSQTSSLLLVGWTSN